MKKALAAIFVLALSLGVASAATVVYETEADFLAAIGSSPFLLEDFDGLTYGSYQEPTWDLGPENGFSGVVSALQGLWSGDGNMSTNNAGDTIDVDFQFSENSVLFVGGEFFASDIDGFYIPGEVTLTLSDGTIEVYDPPAATEFRGFVSDQPILSMSIDASDADGVSRWSTMDHFYAGGEAGGDGGGGGVPATSTWGVILLIALFMTVSLFYLRKRGSQNA